MGIGDMFTRSMAADAPRPPGSARPHKTKAILVVLAAVLFHVMTRAPKAPLAELAPASEG